MIRKCWSEAREQILSGDLLLFRGGRSVQDLVIGRAGRSRYIHAARAAWEYHELRLLDVVQWRGGRNVSLRDQVERHPGRWDVFRPSSRVAAALGRKYTACQAVERMQQFVGIDYGWWNIFRVSLLHLPFVRLIVAPETDDEQLSKLPPYCSHAQAIADRAAGVDPVQNLADRLTEPGDLARSLFYSYQFTLIP